MTVTSLANLESRVAVMLFDSTHRIFPIASIDEGIRLALAEYNLRAGEAATIADLDSATDSTLPQLYESIIVTGAAAYAASSHALEHADTLTPAGVSSNQAALAAWAKTAFDQFHQALDLIFKHPDYLSSPISPYSTTYFWGLPDESGYQAPVVPPVPEGEPPMSEPTVTSVVATIAAGASVSDAILTGGLPICAIQMPAAWDAADISFLASCDLAASVAAVFDKDGVELSTKAAASQFITLDPVLFAGVRYIKVRSGTSGAAVLQSAERKIAIAIRTI